MNYSLSVVLRILLGALYHVWVCLYLIKSGKFWTNYLIEYAKLGLGCQLVLSNDFQCLCPLRVGCHLLLSFLIRGRDAWVKLTATLYIFNRLHSCCYKRCQSVYQRGLGTCCWSRWSRVFLVRACFLLWPSRVAIEQHFRLLFSNISKCACVWVPFWVINIWLPFLFCYNPMNWCREWQFMLA